MSTFAAPKVSLDGPRPTERPYSLLRTVPVVDDLERFAATATIWPYPAGTAHGWAPCSAGSARDKDIDEQADQADFDAFVAYFGIECSSFTDLDDGLRERVTAVLQAVESHTVEHELATGAITGNPAFADAEADVLAAAAVKTLVGVALLEGAIAATGRAGVIHVDPRIGTGLAALNLVAARRGGGGLETVANGTPVVVGAGYQDITPDGEAAPTVDATHTQGWAYATGPVAVRRTPTMALLEAFEQDTNDQMLIAERPYLASWDTVLQAAVLIDLNL